MRTPHTCPACNGQRTVSRPPWVAGDVPTWTGTSTAQYPCPTCSASGVVWEPFDLDERQYAALRGVALERYVEAAQRFMRDLEELQKLVTGGFEQERQEKR